MADDRWIECRLADACTSIDYGLTAAASDRAMGPKFLRITDIVSGHIDWKTVPHVMADASNAAKYRLDDGDIVLARTGASTGASCYINNPPESVFASYLVRLKVKPDSDSRFVAYYLKSDAFWAFMRGVLGDKSAQPNASASTMTQAPFRAPRSKSKQHAIAHILGTLDDKIELNRRMNETLEAMARAIFKSWFVDFLPVREKQRARTQTGDPVKAKMEGRQPAGMDVEAAALFPDELVPSELGMIPKGWRVDNLGKHIEISRESVKPFEHPDEEFDHYSIPGYDDGRRPVTEKGSQIRSSKYIVPETSVLLSKLNPRFPRQWLPNLRERRRSICSTEFLVVQSKTWLSREYLYSFFASSHFQDTYRTMATGTSGSHQRVKPEYLLAEASPIPSVDVIAAFTRVTRPLFAKGARQRRESRTLAELRDTLLPKLISGEMRVPDAEQIAESVL